MTEKKACPRGAWDACKIIVLNEDFLYQCKDCGLMYLNQLERYWEMETTSPTIQCICDTLEVVTKWSMDECLGCNCLIYHYYCSVCGRHYKKPKTAELEKQRSESGRSYVVMLMAFQRREYEERVAGVKRDIKRLIADLEAFDPEERKELLTPLFS